MHFVAVQGDRVLWHLYERSDGVHSGCGDASLDQEPDEVVVRSRCGQRDADSRGGDVFRREDAVRSRRSLSRFAVSRDHGAAREHRSSGLVTVDGRPQQANGRQQGKNADGVTATRIHFSRRFIQRLGL